MSREGPAGDDGTVTAEAGGARREAGAADVGPTDAELTDVELTEDELDAWGRRLGALAARKGVFVALRGPLGAGKTRLVQAACRGAGVEGPVQSPTYTLVRVHRAPEGVVHHADLYRIRDPRELADLGWDELTGGEGAVFVEWADRAERFLPADRWDIFLGMAADPDRRRVRVARRGSAPSPPPFAPEGPTPP